MSFCTECGYSLNAEALQGNFCPECGAKIEKSDLMSKPVEKPAFQKPPPPPPVGKSNQAPPPPLRPKLPPVPGMPIGAGVEKDVDSKRAEVFEPGFNAYGIIFTDTRKIAKQCRSTSNEIFNIVKNYSNRLKKFGTQYIIYDFDSSRYRNLDWATYVEQLSSHYDKQLITPEYLFIIGGTEIIPMPVFDNMSDVEVPDFDYESDIPYSYLKSFEIEDMIWDGSLYYEDVKLHVGRLPFGEDFHKNQLSNYFDRVIASLESGFEVGNCFGLSAEGWQDASETVLDNLDVPNKYIDFSPTVSLDDVDDIFDETSDILYFNLHGSDAPEQPQFFGDWGPAISPDQTSRLSKSNLILTEACYGAKFIGYNTTNSMLLNTIHKNTLGYYGSSRIAFGSNTSFLFSADIIAHSVFGSLSNNMTMGQAMSKARIDSVESAEDDIAFIDMALVTAIEFNFYGDPSLRSFNSGTSFLNSFSSKATKNIPQKLIKEDLYSKKSSQNILDAVRAAVDLEFDKISKIIQKELYEKYELTSDELQHISYQKSAQQEEYLYVYNKMDKKLKKEKLFYINCTTKGSIKRVITSK